MDDAVILILLVPGLVSLIPWFIAKKRGVFSKLDIIFPYIGILIWIGITYFGFGNQSLSNLIELPIILIVSVFLYFIKIFYFHKNKNFLIFVLLICTFVILLRVFFPFIPE